MNTCYSKLLTQDHKKPLDDLFQFTLTGKVAEKGWEDDSLSTVASVTTRTDHWRIAVSQISGATRLCAGCGGNYYCSTCQFRNAKYHKCNKICHIQKAYRSSTAIVQTLANNTFNIFSSGHCVFYQWDDRHPTHYSKFTVAQKAPLSEFQDMDRSW